MRSLFSLRRFYPITIHIINGSIESKALASQGRLKGGSNRSSVTVQVETTEFEIVIRKLQIKTAQPRRIHSYIVGNKTP